MEKVKNTNLLLLFTSIFAGVMISIGCVCFLMIDNKITGALLFTVGLYSICIFNLTLFTGQCHNFSLSNDKQSTLIYLLNVWIGNCIGTIISAFIIFHTRIINNIGPKSFYIVNDKINDNLFSLISLSIFCGILMYVAVVGYKLTERNPLILFICVSSFILCGFEHSIANMFYFFINIHNFDLIDIITTLLVITMGNFIGCNIIPITLNYCVLEKTGDEDNE